ncbi:MAG: hypothetical protein Q7K43_00255, partial [Candidatus Woesearchaeota archaeon]|nr:hypothetical protein [Candidatus Woesearchaeota archaeon]
KAIFKDNTINSEIYLELLTEPIIQKHKINILADPHALSDKLLLEILSQGVDIKTAITIVKKAITNIFAGDPDKQKEYTELFDSDQQINMALKGGQPNFNVLINGKQFRLNFADLKNYVLRRHAFGVAIASDKQQKPTKFAFLKNVPSLNFASVAKTPDTQQLEEYSRIVAGLPSDQMIEIRKIVLRELLNVIRTPDKYQTAIRQDNEGNNIIDYRKVVAGQALEVIVTTNNGVIEHFSPY